MSIEKPKLEKEEKEPIIDIELNEATLEIWEKHKLNEAVHDLIFGFEDLVEPEEKFVLCSAKFEVTGAFVNAAEKSFSKFKGKNLEEKIKEVENEARKAILNFTFKELEFDPKNPEIVKQEKIKQNDKELIVQHFKTNQPKIILGSDSIDWWLERPPARDKSR